MPVKNRIGHRYGRLKVVERAENTKRGVMWRCQCDCGALVIKPSDDLEAGHVRSCGCLKREMHTTHGLSGDPLYRVWYGIKQRCENPRAQSYSHYGGRGITLDRRWQTFEAFYEDVAPRPEGATLDRIDNDGPYSPENCRWATRKEQSNNTRLNQRITFNGMTMTKREWATHLGISEAAMHKRLNRWPLERALTEPVNKKHRSHQGSLPQS